MLKNFSLSIGDVIIAKKKSGLSRIISHYVVYVGDGNFIGNLVGGVRLIDYSELVSLMDSYEPIKVRKFQGSHYERHRALQRAYSRLGQKYNLLTFNCEHFANWVQYGKNFSNQVKTFAFIALVGSVLIYANRRNLKF